MKKNFQKNMLEYLNLDFVYPDPKLCELMQQIGIEYSEKNDEWILTTPSDPELERAKALSKMKSFSSESGVKNLACPTCATILISTPSIPTREEMIERAKKEVIKEWSKILDFTQPDEVAIVAKRLIEPMAKSMADFAIEQLKQSK